MCGCRNDFPVCCKVRISEQELTEKKNQKIIFKDTETIEYLSDNCILNYKDTKNCTWPPMREIKQIVILRKIYKSVSATNVKDNKKSCWSSKKNYGHIADVNGDNNSNNSLLSAV